MSSEDQEPLKPRRTRKVRLTRDQTHPLVILVIRVGFVLMMSGLACLLAHNGRNAIRDRHFDNRWITVTSTGINSHYESRFEKGEERLDGEQAVHFGIGLLAAAAMLAEWSVGLVISIICRTKVTDKRTWTVIHSLATIFSFACLLTALVFLLPPDRIENRLFIRVFYGTITVLSVAVIATLVANRPRIAALIFPAAAVSAVFIAPLAGGIIFGFFAWLALATHVVLLVPSLRRQSFRDA